MKNIIKFFDKIPQDKLLHSYISTILTTICYFISNFFCSANYAIILGAVIVLIIGIIKEIIDLFIPGRDANFNDIIADLIGIGIGIIVIILLVKIT